MRVRGRTAAMRIGITNLAKPLANVRICLQSTQVPVKPRYPRRRNVPSEETLDEKRHWGEGESLRSTRGHGLTRTVGSGGGSAPIREGEKAAFVDSCEAEHSPSILSHDDHSPDLNNRYRSDYMDAFSVRRGATFQGDAPRACMGLWLPSKGFKA